MKKKEKYWKLVEGLGVARGKKMLKKCSKKMLKKKFSNFFNL